jgi:chromosome segregation ATPase
MSETTSANLTQEAHEALVQKAVKEATEQTDAVLKTKIDEIATLTESIKTLTEEKDDATSDLTRVNGELDKAQVDLKTAQDEVASLKAEVAKRDEDAALAETASKRAEQVKNLKLFTDDFVTERASTWASLSEDDWAARMEEWKAMKPAETPSGDTTKADTAMSGSNGNLTKDPPTDEAADKKRPGRAVLGLK